MTKRQDKSMVDVRSALIGLGSIGSAAGIATLVLLSTNEVAAAVLAGLVSIPTAVRFFDRVIHREG